MAENGELPTSTSNLQQEISLEERIKRNQDLGRKFNAAISAPKHDKFVTNSSKKDMRRVRAEATEGLVRIPKGKRGLVLGSGSHTSMWRNRGWETLDIDPRHKPDYIWDVKRLGEKFVSPLFDFILAEHLVGRNVSLDRLLDQTDMVIKPSGKLIIQTSLHVPNPTIPKEFQTSGPFWAERWAAFLDSAAYGRPNVERLQRRQRSFMQCVAKHGYATVADLHQMVDLPSGNTVQRVVYYAEKVG